MNWTLTMQIWIAVIGIFLFVVTLTAILFLMYYERRLR